MRLTVLILALLTLSLPVRAEEPALLSADVVTYDETTQTITADGHVRLSHQGSILTAQQLSYNRATEVATASGGVKMWQPTGEVVLADHVQLSRDMRQAFANEIGIILTDNSRFVAAEGERTEGRFVRMNKALYSACQPCRENPDKPLLWQIQAERVIHDMQTHDITYRNATFELAGVPVFYTPYMSHPDPTVKRRTGFLNPVIGTRPNLGTTVRTYYYLDLAPNKDATIETTYSADRGLLLGGEWRQRTADSHLKLNFSGTMDDIPNDVSGQPARQDKLRGHLFIDAATNINDHWRAGADIKRATDDTYLDLWRYSDADTLTSRAYLERFTETSYGVVDAYSFQDLRPNITENEPNVIPHVAYRAQGRPQSLWGGRWALGAETRTVTRSSEADSTRVSTDIGWRRDFYTPVGLVFTSENTARADAFYSNDLPSGEDDATELRPFAQTQLTARMPFVRQMSKGQFFLEPVGQLTGAPGISKIDRDIVNEESQSLEFDFAHLFAPNRFSGVDLLDGGSRGAYAMRGGWAGNNGAAIDFGVGQSVAFEERTGFPEGSGLEDRFSDIVGEISADLPPYVDMAYAFRLDHTTLDPREHNIRGSVGTNLHRAGLSYLYADQTTADGTRSLREEITGGIMTTLDDNWKLEARHRHNLQSIGPIDSDIALTYQDECLTFSLVAERDYVTREGLSDGDSLFFRIAFKNLGEFESPTFSPDIFGGSPSEPN